VSWWGRRSPPGWASRAFVHRRWDSGPRSFWRLARPFAERVRELEELSARHEVEADVEGVEEYLVMMTEAWRRISESA
jgi:hypothetical protein